MSTTTAKAGDLIQAENVKLRLIRAPEWSDSWQLWRVTGYRWIKTRQAFAKTGTSFQVSDFRILNTEAV